MKFALATIAAALACATPAFAQDAQVIRVGDSALTCPQIIEEANAAATVMGGAPEGGVFTSSAAISAMTSFGMQGAIMSGAGRAVPGIGLASNLLSGAARRREAEQAAARDQAQRRWYYLNGLYSGHDCDRVLQEQAAQQAAPAPETPAAAQ